MPALPTPTTDFLTKIKNDLSVGKDIATPGSGNIRAAALNYLRAQDMATVLELLQDGLDQPTELTATGGSTTTVEDTGAFTADAQVGNYVVFAADTTTVALRGLSFRVTANTTGVLTVAGPMPAAAAAGDEYTLVAGLVDEAISDLREGKGLADAPAGSVYGDMRIVSDALVRMVKQLGASVAERNIGRPGLKTAAGSTTTVINLKTAGVNYRIDELVGTKMTISGESRRVLRNDESSATVSAAYSSAPAADTAVAITVPADDAHPASPNLKVHPGAQPGENVYLADLIGQAQAAVVAFTLPT